MKTYKLRSPEDIAALTEEWGFLPFFAGMVMNLTPVMITVEQRQTLNKLLSIMEVM